MKIIEILAMFLPDINNPLAVHIFAAIGASSCLGFILLFSGLLDFIKPNVEVKKND